MKTALSGPTTSTLRFGMSWAFGVCALGGVACGKVSEASPGASTIVPVAAGPAAATTATPEVDHPNYSARMQAVGACRRDQACVAEIIVTAKGDYHINDKYPYRFKLDEPPPGVRYPKPVVDKEDAATEERKLTLKVPFISESTGEKRVAGTLSLSVCSPANCLMDKQALEVSIKVD